MVLLNVLCALLVLPALSANATAPANSANLSHSSNTTGNCLEFHVIKNKPMGFYDEDNIPQGVHWDYLTAIEQESGICINKTIMPYARIWESIKNGHHDGGIIFRSASRSSLVHYVGKIRAIKTVAIPLQGKKLEHYSALSKLIIGKTRKTHLGKQFDNDIELQVVDLNNYEQAIKMINQKRIDVIAGGVMALYYQIKQNNALNLINLNGMLTLGEKEQWLQLAQNSQHSDKIEALQQAIERLRKNGELDNIMDKYYGKHWRVINH